MPLLSNQSFGTGVRTLRSIPFFTPGIASGTVQSLSVNIASPDSQNWGLAIYNDSSGSPGTLNCSAFSGATPSTGVNTLSLSGCTYAANTQYWATYITVSSTQQAPSFSDHCPPRPMGPSENLTFSTYPQGFHSTSGISQFLSNSDWPASYPAGATTTACWDIYATINYPGKVYNVVSMGQSFILANVNTLILNILPTTAGSTLYIGYVTDSNRTLSSFADSASDTITTRGACNSGLGANTVGSCLGSVDRATAGTSSITATLSGAALNWLVFYYEINGTAASSSFDQSNWASSVQSTPFTSGNITTTAAPELLLGIVFDANGGPHDFRPGDTNWFQPMYHRDVNWDLATYLQPVTATGTYNLTGSFAVVETQLAPSILSFK
jgi:hypothetical protein